MRKTLIRAEDRGFANHGWLKTYHTFSFANYFDESRMGFGNIRVFNDDIVEPDMGFGTHPHDNMEIISIPLSGTMAHKDSQGNEYIIEKNDIQIMSAGSGLTHSEYNYSQENNLNFLQIWVYPKVYDTKPEYYQKKYNFPLNQLIPIIRPDEKYETLPIKQDVYFHFGIFKKDTSVNHLKIQSENGLFLFLIEGKIDVEGESLHKRDSIGIENTAEIEINFKDESKILLIETPMDR